MNKTIRRDQHSLTSSAPNQRRVSCQGRHESLIGPRCTGLRSTLASKLLPAAIALTALVACYQVPAASRREQFRVGQPKRRNRLVDRSRLGRRKRPQHDRDRCGLFELGQHPGGAQRIGLGQHEDPDHSQRAHRRL